MSRFAQVDGSFVSSDTGACAVAAFSTGLNGSAASLAYAARHDKASFGIVTVDAPAGAGT